MRMITEKNYLISLHPVVRLCLLEFDHPDSLALSDTLSDTSQSVRASLPRTTQQILLLRVKVSLFPDSFFDGSPFTKSVFIGLFSQSPLFQVTFIDLSSPSHFQQIILFFT